MQFYLGSYSDETSKGIYLVDIDAETGKLSAPQWVAEATNPTFMAFNPKFTHLYAIAESSDFAAKKQAAIIAYAVDPVTRKLTELSRQPSGGQGACYVSTDQTGRQVFVANYGSADVEAIPVDKDGSLSAPSAVLHQTGTGPNLGRQDKPHAHSIIVDPTNDYALSADLGADRIYIYGIDNGRGELIPKPPFACPPGSGPRHMAFHPNGRILYVVTELAATVLVLDWDASTGMLAQRQSILSLPADYPLVDNTASEIALHPNARWLYVANRGHDSIAQFSVNTNDQTLNLLGNVSTHGHGPRHFGIDPSGRVLVVANQHAGNVTAFKLDKATGAAEFTDSFVWNKPMCIRFLPAA